MMGFTGALAAAGNEGGTLSLTLSAPTSASLYEYSGGKRGIQWANAYSDAYCQVWNGSGAEPVVTQELPPGSTSWDSGTTNTTLGVRHRRGSEISGWTQASAS